MRCAQFLLLLIILFVGSINATNNKVLKVLVPYVLNYVKYPLSSEFNKANLVYFVRERLDKNCKRTLNVLVPEKNGMVTYSYEEVFDIRNNTVRSRCFKNNEKIWFGGNFFSKLRYADIYGQLKMMLHQELGYDWNALQCGDFFVDGPKGPSIMLPDGQNYSFSLKHEINGIPLKKVYLKKDQKCSAQNIQAKNKLEAWCKNYMPGVEIYSNN